MSTPPSLVRSVAFACMATAISSSVLLGLLETTQPMFGQGGYTLNSVSAWQRWAFGILQALKSIGFVAGLAGFVIVATRRGAVMRVVLGLAALGGAAYAAVWIMIAKTGRDDAVYVLHRAVGSDTHGNGGLLFLWLAPIAVGIAGLVAHRIPRWAALWPIIVGLLGSRIFGLFRPGTALVIEGLLWLVLGYVVHRYQLLASIRETENPASAA